MAEKHMFFNSIDHDRVYDADDFTKYIGKFVGNGISAAGGELLVTANNNMSVTISAGSAWIEGKLYINDSPITFTVPTADSTLNRIDRIVIRLDRPQRLIGLKLITGTASSSAIPPSIYRNADYYDLCLADISVVKGQISVTQSSITDNRLNNTLCGLVRCPIERIPTETIMEQFNTWLQEAKTETTDSINTILGQLNELLNGDTVGQLFNKINDLENSSVKDVRLGGTSVISGNIANLPAYPTALPANGGTSASCSGNSATATKLQTARNINGVAFDGTRDITITADPNAHNHDAGNINTGTLPVERGGIGVDNRNDIAEITSRFARSAYHYTSGINTSSILTMADTEINYHNNRNPSIYKTLNVCDLIYARQSVGAGSFNTNSLSAKAENYPFAIIYAESTQTTSDRRKKDNITSLNIEDAFDLLDKTDVYSFNYKDSPDKLRYGFIAQELDQKFKGSSLEVFYGLHKTPIYKKDDDGTQLEEIEDYTWSVDYSSWVPALVSAVKHLVRENKDKESRLTELEDQILRLRQEIDEINQ